MTVEEGREFFDAVPFIARKLQTLIDVGLSYIRLGQSAVTCRGRSTAGQAGQGAVQTGHRQNPVHPGRAHDRPALLRYPATFERTGAFARSRQHHRRHRAQPGRHQDRRLDCRPRSGRWVRWGTDIAEGTPEEVAANPASHTGRYLKPMLTK